MSTLTRSMVVAVSLFIAALLASDLPAQGSVTAYIGNDLPGLRAAKQKDPNNLGLRMRVIRRLLDRVRETTRVQESRTIFRQLESEMDDLIKLQPAFPYPYRVLARLYYRRGDYEKVLSLYGDFQKIAPLDQEMRSLYTKSLLRLGTDEENPAPVRLEEAARFVGEWFNSGDAPSFGKTLGVCSVWLREDGFRRELLKTFREQYAANPKNLNLVISYAALLSALGRNESAWKIVQDAEVVGLCDSITGARHPVAYLLERDCPEVFPMVNGVENPAQSYDGMLIDELEARMKQFPQNVSFPLRAALVYKRRGDSATQLRLLFEKRAEVIVEEGGPKAAEEAGKFENRAAEFGAEAKKNFGLALPFAQKAFDLNSSIEATSLLLGDIQFKLENYAEAERCFRKGLELVPRFAELREGLARVYKERKDWQRAADELAEVCAVIPCNAGDWDDTAEDSLVPVPGTSHERLVTEFARDPQGRVALAKSLEAAARAKPKNPNLPTFLAMLHYFAGRRADATRWMIQAEKVGICGEAGHQHELASFILDREDW